MIHLIKNVLTNQQRRKLIRDCQPLFVELGDQFPGRQTGPRLHLHSDFTSPINDILRIAYKTTGLNLVLSKSWVNWSNGMSQHSRWHRHQCDYALVYYMRTPLPFFSNGTVFRSGLFTAPQNSMIIFPGQLEHSAPSSPFRFDRYTMAMDLNYDNHG